LHRPGRSATQATLALVGDSLIVLLLLFPYYIVWIL
jgi:hypothetical protein